MGAARLFWQFLKLHTSTLQSRAVAGYQTSCSQQLWPCCSGRISNCARGCPAAVSGSQTASLSKGRANMQQQQQQQQRQVKMRSVRVSLRLCTALHYTALHCTALHCTALHCTATGANLTFPAEFVLLAGLLVFP
jgi:hypothetical protein